ncbi:MAG TPA: HNH endonuclease [Bacteriovoracaceae bacterium]|nr:HNH endonuclease [Bacteriovoracaceae bacterium]
MKLSQLTDQNLHTSTLSLANKEREILTQLLWHLREIDKRKLFSDHKSGSLFEYCVKVLKYSEGQASRRVSACRLLRDLPSISLQIEKGTINLTQLNLAKSFFDDQNVKSPTEKEKIIFKLEGKTTRESEKILSELKGGETGKLTTTSIIIKEGTYSELKSVQRLRSHKCPDLDSLLMELCKEVRQLWEIRSHRDKKVSPVSTTRYIPVQVRAEVWNRDQGKCSLCASTTRLEFDHVKPFGAGGETSTKNLRILCRNCNQRKALIFYGQKVRTYQQKGTMLI